MNYELFNMAFGICLVITGMLTWVTSQGSKNTVGGSMSKSFKGFQRNYLCVYYLAMMSDWLQGPYVYALYSSYGFNQGEIAQLFVAGFGSSMIFGTFVGALADRMGRKQACIWFCITYILSCVTKHFKDYQVLMLGRVLGGIATSLLFSSFESWMVCAHNNRGYDPAWISATFSKAIFGNGVVAIVAGLVAERAADSMALTKWGDSATSSMMIGGYCSPFDLSMCTLGITWMIVQATWSENYGDKTSTEAVCSSASLQTAMNVIWRDSTVFYSGMVQSLFEGSMYTFVFMWTPVLTPDGDAKPPYGLIFATFMVCCMAGSSIFGVLISKYPVEQFTIYVYVIAAGALCLPALTSDISTLFMGFLIFECCVGIYFPAMGTIKGKYVPENARAAIYNLFRVPLNAIVLFVLLTNLSRTVTFFCCAGMLISAAFAQSKLYKASLCHAANQPTEDVDELLSEMKQDDKV
jgi:MFS family permease